MQQRRSPGIRGVVEYSRLLFYVHYPRPLCVNGVFLVGRPLRILPLESRVVVADFNQSRDIYSDRAACSWKSRGLRIHASTSANGSVADTNAQSHYDHRERDSLCK